MSSVSEHRLELPPETGPGDVELQTCFAEHGFAVVPCLFAREECREITATLAHHSMESAWAKGLAATSPLFFQLRSDSRISGLVSQLIGEDVILWGAKIVRRHPGQVHPFHSDLETVDQPGKTATVWIGLEHTAQGSALKLVSRSHLFGRAMQQSIFEHGCERGQPTDEMILSWARERDPLSAIVQPDVTNRDAILFDGRLWHASDNTNPNGIRTALLLQYSTPDTRIRVPAQGSFSWPLSYDDSVKPPVLLIRGIDRHGVNRIVPVPKPGPKGHQRIRFAGHHAMKRVRRAAGQLLQIRRSILRRTTQS